MPAVVTMESGGQGGAQSDHGQNPKANGVNGAGTQAPAKDAAAAPTQVGDRPLELRPSRMNDLPDEIVHITEGFVPLSLLLTRLAQTTHNSLQDKIVELAKMPTPVGAVNGNSTHPAGDDASNENLRKKSALLNFAQEMHAKWVKALVIAEWSRKSEMVSKLIDLKWHIDQQRILYDTMLDQIVHVKRDLTYARVPSPDLKTALQVLSTGSAPWMPDVSVCLA
jgi:mediator of RNA polymerase II transcription subunit 14